MVVFVLAAVVVVGIACVRKRRAQKRVRIVLSWLRSAVRSIAYDQWTIYRLENWLR